MDMARPASAVFAAGVWTWQSQEQDRMRVRLQVVPSSRIEVGIWWNRDAGPADVRLIFGLYPGAVELGSLSGNGYDTPDRHRRGFGTLAVNVAVQALQARCAPQLPVRGVLSNTDEDGLPAAQRARLQADRAAFWRRFGLDVVARGAPPLDYLEGRVAGLRTVPDGLVAGQFPRLIALASFVRA